MQQLTNIIAPLRAIIVKILIGLVLGYTLICILFFCFADINSIFTMMYKLLVPLALSVAVVIVVADSMRKIADEESTLAVKIFSTIALFATPIAYILFVIEICNPELMYSTSSSYYYTPSIYSKIVNCVFYLAAVGFLGSLTLVIKNRNEKFISYIKYAAIGFLVIAVICSLVVTFGNTGSSYYNQSGGMSSADVFKFNIASIIGWISWFAFSAFAFYLSKFDKFHDNMPLFLKGKTTTNPAPALIIPDSTPEPTSAPEPAPAPSPAPTVIPVTTSEPTPIQNTPAENIYPEEPEGYRPKPRLEGENLNAAASEPLHSLGESSSEILQPDGTHPAIGQSVASNESSNQGGSFDSFSNNNQDGVL